MGIINIVLILRGDLRICYLNQQKPAGGGVESSSKSLKAFTLAEVLITLVVIGIVAAITIPIIASNYEKRQLYSQFMKTYSTITNALNLALIDYPNPMTWQTHEKGSSDYIKTYMLPYLSNAIASKPLSEITTTDYKDLAGNSISSIIQEINASNLPVVQLPSGAFVVQYLNVIFFDVNGSKKPNVVGRDMFVLHPAISVGDSNCVASGKPICPELDPDDCISGNGLMGDSCSNKLLAEGKISY